MLCFNYRSFIQRYFWMGYNKMRFLQRCDVRVSLSQHDPVSLRLGMHRIFGHRKFSAENGPKEHFRFSAERLLSPKQYGRNVVMTQTETATCTCLSEATCLRCGRTSGGFHTGSLVRNRARFAWKTRDYLEELVWVRLLPIPEPWRGSRECASNTDSGAHLFRK